LKDNFAALVMRDSCSSLHPRDLLLAMAPPGSYIRTSGLAHQIFGRPGAGLLTAGGYAISAWWVDGDIEIDQRDGDNLTEFSRIH